MEFIKPKTVVNELVPQKYIVGSATTKTLNNGVESGIHISETTFDAGSYTHWHKHPHTQILIGKEGIGFVQKRGEELRCVQPDDIVVIHAGEIHWHGAGTSESFTHTAMQLDNDEGIIIDPLSDLEYNQIDSNL